MSIGSGRGEIDGPGFVPGSPGLVLPYQGGTGMDSSSSDGVAAVSGGGWSVGNFDMGGPYAAGIGLPAHGCTGLDTHASTGVPLITAGTWSVAVTTGTTSVVVLQVGPTLFGPVTDSGLLIVDEANFVTTRLDSQGAAWSTRTAESSLVFNSASGKRPEISWYRGNSTSPQATLRMSTSADRGLEVWTGTGLANPILVAQFNAAAGLIGLTTFATAANVVALVTKGFASQSADLRQYQDSSANVLSGTDSAGQRYLQTANGAKWVEGSNSELITLSTSGATTDSSANLLPANSIIQAVVARITTTIATATNWKMGDGTTADRFTAANSTLTSGTQDIGLRHQQGSIATDAAGQVQTAAAKLRITTTGTPSAGVVRVTVFYRTYTAPTS